MLWGVFMVFKFDFKKFLISVFTPLIVGGISALMVGDNVNIYSKIKNPPISPPGWLFPVVWTVLYFLMGVSLYLVWSSETVEYLKRTAYAFWGIQLFFNFIWSPIFFNKQWFLPAFVILLTLWAFTCLMIVSFYKISRRASLLQIPYLIWLTFAGYLNFAIYLLN